MMEPIASLLRRGNVHAGRRLVSVVKRIVPVLKESFPDARVVHEETGEKVRLKTHQSGR